MDPLAAGELAGSWVPVLPPLAEDGTLCLDLLERELEALMAAGARRLFLGGAQSEWSQFGEAEFDAGLACLARFAAAAGLPFVAGATHTDAAQEHRRVETASSYEPGAIRVGLPADARVSSADLVTHLASLAEAAAPAGLVLDLGQEVVAQIDLRNLVEACPFVVGLSLDHFDEAVLERLAVFEDELAILVPGDFLAAGFRHGALGSFSRLALLSPAGAQAWYDSLAEDMDAALSLELRVQRFTEDWIAPYATRRGFSPAAVDKLMLAVGGWFRVGTRVVFPDAPIDDSEAERLIPLARERLPEFFSD